MSLIFDDALHGLGRERIRVLVEGDCYSTSIEVLVSLVAAALMTQVEAVLHERSDDFSGSNRAEWPIVDRHPKR
jgi:hypothetical protein